jgi:hypothetical protein
MFPERINQALAEVDTPEHLVEHTLGVLENQGLIERDAGYYRVLPLAVQYELQFDREEFRRRNVLRREALHAAARAFETEDQWAVYAEPADQSDESSASFTELPYADAAFAVRSLELFGFVELREFMGRNFEFKITPAGYDLARDEDELRATLPITESEDSEAQDVPSAFISYAHEDQEFVLALAQELEAQGLEISYDRVALHIGDSLIRALAGVITNGDFLIAVVSPDSVESEWCQKELALAATQGINEHRVKVLPVRYRGADMPPMLGDTYWGDADNDDIPTLARRLAAAINAQLGGAGHEAAVRAAAAITDGGGEPPHAEVAGDAVVAQLDVVAQRMMDVLQQWAKCRTGAGPTDDLKDRQYRLRWELDSLPSHVRAALPLTASLAEADWNEYFRLVEPAVAEPDLREELRSVRSQVAQGLPVVRRWMIVRDHGEVSASSRDATAYLWEIAREGDEDRRVMVYISGSAMASENSTLPKEVADAKDTHGRSVLSALVAVDDPPREVMVSTAGISWTLPD